jgi:hypothetical protein
MVVTTFKSGAELIEAIKKANVDYNLNGNIYAFYQNVAYLRDDIKANISNDLYKKFDMDMRTVYYEHLYGDGENSDLAVKNCIKVLDNII